MPEIKLPRHLDISLGEMSYKVGLEHYRSSLVTHFVLRFLKAIAQRCAGRLGEFADSRLGWVAISGLLRIPSCY
jgi:hypothetical protein